MSEIDLPPRLEGYRLERVLGRGGMGIVHQAWDERLRRRVAIKRVLPERSEPRRRERLRREARTAAQLAHPAIVQIFDLVESDDADWIVMELVEGRSLAELVREGPLDVDRALDIGRQVAEGLAAAHALGIVHRDLKTENVAVLDDDRVKILDFGLAKRLPADLESGAVSSLGGDLSDLSEVGQVLGTGRAMSPEQARGLEVGPRSDLFSLGVLLYEVTSGVSPFRGSSFYDTLAQVAAHQPAPLVERAPGTPARLSELIDRLLAKAPELRPPNARAVADTLRDLADERRIARRSSRSANETPMDESETWTDNDPSADSRSTYSAALGSGPRLGLGRWLVIASALAIATLGLVWLAGRPPNPVGREEAPTAASTDPLRLHDDGMRALRHNYDPANVEHAVDLFQRLLERDPGSAAAHAGLARAYWEKARNPSASGDPIFLEQAEAVAREAVRLDPYLADARVSLGLVELLAGRREEARGELETAVELDPNNADAHFGLARLEQAEGRPESAEGHYRQAIELAPAPVYYDALGAVLYAAGRYDEAEAAFLASLDLAPDDVYALRNLGVVYFALGRTDDAASAFQRALKLRPDASLYSNLGTIYFSRGLYSKAAAAFEDALRVDGAANHYAYWINLADAYRQMPDKEDEAASSYRSALRLLDEHLEAAPDDLVNRSRRALARARLGDSEGARRDIARAREIDVENDVYSQFRLLVAEELNGDREAALADLEDALRAGLDLSEVRREPDLLQLRADPRFHQLLTTLD